MDMNAPVTGTQAALMCVMTFQFMTASRMKTFGAFLAWTVFAVLPVGYILWKHT